MLQFWFVYFLKSLQWLLTSLSGTTGKPKGVEVRTLTFLYLILQISLLQTTHKNIVSVLEIVAEIYPKLTFGVDAMLGILPFYHIYGTHLLDSPSTLSSSHIIYI